MTNTPDWRHRAACKDEDPELFFPVGTGKATELQIEMAKDVCHRCEVRSECLRWAFDMGLDAGVFGGTTESERRENRLAKRQRAAARAAASSS